MRQTIGSKSAKARSRFHSVILLIGFIALLAGLGCQQPQQTSAQSVESKAATGDLADQAMTQFLKGDYDEAIVLYEKLLRAEPDNQDALENVALAHANKGLDLKDQGKYEEALLQLSKAEKIADDYPDIRSAIEECRNAIKGGQVAEPQAAPAAAPAEVAEDAAPAKPAIDTSSTPQNTARVSYASGDTVVKGEQDEQWAHATENTVVQSKDTVVTGDDGLSELELSNGALVQVANSSKLDMDTIGGEAKLKLWKGSVHIDTSGVSAGDVQVETPTGAVAVSADSRVRVDVDEDGGTRLTTFAGQAYIDDKSGEPPAPVKQEERVYVEPGSRASTTVRVTREGYDDFDTWSYDRTETYVSASAAFPAGVVLPPVGYRELATSGEWMFMGGAYVWRPVIVQTGWVPYRRGYWSWVAPAGWTWVSYDPFGYVTSHYGNWSFASSYGWVWHPGVVYTPAAVTFIEVGDHVAWAPLGLNGRPAVAIGASFHIGDFDFDLSVVSGAMAASFGIGVVEATVIEPAFFTRVAAPRVVNNVNINLNFAPKRIIRGHDTVVRNNVTINASATVDRVNRTIRRSSFSVATAVSAQKTTATALAAKESKLRVALAENVKKSTAEQKTKASDLISKNKEVARASRTAEKGAPSAAAKLLAGKAEKPSEKKPKLMPRGVSEEQLKAAAKEKAPAKRPPVVTPRATQKAEKAKKTTQPEKKGKAPEKLQPREKLTPSAPSKEETKAAAKKATEKPSLPPPTKKTEVAEKAKQPEKKGKAPEKLEPQEKATAPAPAKEEKKAVTEKAPQTSKAESTPAAQKTKVAEPEKAQTPSQKATAPPEKKAEAPQEKKADTAEKKAAPAQKTSAPAKEARPDASKETPAAEKGKAADVSSKQVVMPQPEKKTETPEKKATAPEQKTVSQKQVSQPEDKKTPTAEKEKPAAPAKPAQAQPDKTQQRSSRSTSASQKSSSDSQATGDKSSKGDSKSKKR